MGTMASGVEMKLGKHLGTQNHKSDRYDYYESDGPNPTNVFQVKNGDTDAAVWMCSLYSWHNAIHRICNA